MREILSNLLFELAALGAVGVIVWSFLIGPRLKGRLAYNWVLRRVALAFPDAAVTNQGKCWRKKLKVTWQTTLGAGSHETPVQLELALAEFAPWDVRIRIAETGQRPRLIRTYRWRQWPHFTEYFECSNRREMLDAITGAVRRNLNPVVRREFRNAQDFAIASRAGFPGLPDHILIRGD